MSKVKSEDSATYNVDTYQDNIEKQDEIIDAALFYLRDRLRKPGTVIDSPKTTTDYLKLKLAKLEHEIFACVFLDNRHRVIEYCELFRGTIDGASVHPREIVKTALSVNAAAVIFAHNHPSGIPEPSRADQTITKRLQEACQLVDVRVLDHIIIGGMESVSFAERGLI